MCTRDTLGNSKELQIIIYWNKDLTKKEKILITGFCDFVHQ